MRKEKLHIICSRKYLYKSGTIYYFFKAHKKYEQSIIVNFTNDKGDISFQFTDLSTEENKEFKEPGEYVFPLIKEHKYKIIIKTSGACGSHKIYKKTIKE